MKNTAGNFFTGSVVSTIVQQTTEGHLSAHHLDFFNDNVRSEKRQHLVICIKTYLFGIGKNLARDNVRKSGATHPSISWNG